MTSQPNSATGAGEGPGATGYVALIFAWAVPGLGHFMLGEKARGVVFAVTIHGMFAVGLLLAGMRAINPPEQQIWTYTQFLTGWPMLVANKVQKSPSVQQFLPPNTTDQRMATAKEREYDAGRPTVEDESKESMADRAAYGKAFIEKNPLFAFHPKVQDIGAVYCGIAGMLNLLVIFDVLLRITGSEREVPGKRKVAVAGQAGPGGGA